MTVFDDDGCDEKGFDEEGYDRDGFFVAQKITVIKLDATVSE
ncbi:hypothetical protein [Vibrio crassostreae]|nr:hypothetical protein [Vibrio crassostreae]